MCGVAYWSYFLDVDMGLKKVLFEGSKVLGILKIWRFVYLDETFGCQFIWSNSYIVQHSLGAWMCIH